MKKKLLISFSGGETSAYMTYWLMENKRQEFDMIVVFANTGEENEATLEFVNRCDTYWRLNVVWVEAITNPKNKKGVTAKVVSYETASRNGEPFEAMIAKHGIPNMNNPHCSRELKQRTIKAYAKQIGWKDYHTAIGIRADEIDRISSQRIKERLYYPLCTNECSKTKIDINLVTIYLFNPDDY